MMSEGTRDLVDLVYNVDVKRVVQITGVSISERSMVIYANVPYQRDLRFQAILLCTREAFWVLDRNADGIMVSFFMMLNI